MALGVTFDWGHDLANRARSGARYVALWALRNARLCLEDAVKHAVKRETMGKKLADHQAIRMKIAEIGARARCGACRIIGDTGRGAVDSEASNGPRAMPCLSPCRPCSDIV